MPTVLVADDEPNVLDFMKTVLGRNGFAVLVASSGQEALDAFESVSGQVDVLVSDVVMPVMDGPTLVAEITRQKPELPVLFVSGYVGKPEFRQALGSHRPNILLKPFSPDVLLQRIKRLLPS
jgi:two-component system cell cycle sensor histidine kinase/response regulator CckA